MTLSYTASRAVTLAKRGDSNARAIAKRAFSRAAGAPLIGGNDVRLLKNAHENYPAWLDAIHSADDYIHFEMYIIHEDDLGWMFADALIDKARQGVRVSLIYDWMGGFGKASRSFWNHLRDGGVEVRCYNPPGLGSPFGWLSRDHRKMIAVDGRIGFVTGLCVGRMWAGEPEKHIEPWRDTGVEVRGPALADIERAFAHVWSRIGEPLPEREIVTADELPHAGDVALRVIAGEPASAETFRLDQLVAAIAQKRLWLTDAYYTGTASYVQSLCAAARDGVDVRLLVPNSTDIAILNPLTKAGYRPLLEAGARVFEWNGTMLHAKTAVADGSWARVGSTSLNFASWFGNFELDVMIEDENFARQMEEMYLQDLQNATEVVLEEDAHKVRTSNTRRRAFVTTALRVGSAVGAAFTNRRVLEPIEAHIMLTTGALLLLLGILFVIFPKVLVYPVVVLFVWMALVLLYKGYKLYRSGPNRIRQDLQDEPVNPVNDP